MKNNLIILICLITISIWAQEYPLNEEVKIYYEKDWRPTSNKDSASYYRLITFKDKNIPLGIVNDYYINDIKQSSFYATYVGYDSKGIDSVFQNGPEYYYHPNGNKKLDRNLINNVMIGETSYYYESGKLQGRGFYVNGFLEGKYLNYYESGELLNEMNYINGKREGISNRYYKSGELEVITNYKNNIRTGETIGYYKDGVKSYKGQYVNGRGEGEQIFYYKSGKIRAINPYSNGEVEGQQKAFYQSGELEQIRNYKNDLQQGESYSYYKSGNLRTKVNYIDDLRQGQLIKFYESGEVHYIVNYIDDLKQGEQTFYKSGQIKDSISGLYKPVKIDYTELYLNDERVDRKIALVIGNGAYDKGPLKNPVNDANLIAESLKKLDFDVHLHNNLSSRDEMLDAIKDFGRKRADYEIGFIYYAGHGIQLNNQNYLLPVNEEFKYEEDVEDNGVSMQRVLRYLESTRENQLNFIVLDACRDNPFESNWNKTRSLKGGGLAKIPPPTGSLIAYSTDHGQTAADGDGANSLYSKALAEKLLEEDVSIEQVFKNVRTEVLRLSGNKQSPVEESKLTGDNFYLNKRRER